MSQLRTWPIHGALLSQCQCHSPAEALTTKSEILTGLPSLSQNRFTLYESLPDCTSSLSVVYGQLCARFKPQLGCQLRGMGLIFPHSHSSALGTVSGDDRLWLRGPPVSLCRGLMPFVLIANDNAMDRSPHEDRLSPIQASQGSPGAFLTSPDSRHSWFLLSLSLGYG